jgi:ubiquinone/menaquinone biosynthesis C-methylase UbiE
MSLIEKIHGQCVFQRRVTVIAGCLAALLPRNASVLDVGCGDGSLAKLIQDQRPDVRIHGIDVLVRPQTAIPVEPFDGTHIPVADGSYDVVMFVDVLHHTNDPLVLLREARRVARQSVLLKDHTRNGFLAGPTLRFMDNVGNARYGVALPYNYWPREQWQAAFHELGLKVETWQQKLGLYSAWADWLFGRSLHFIACVDVCERSNG